MSIKLNSSSGGSVTLQEPTTDNNYTLTVPAETGTVISSVSDITAQVKSATNASGSAPIYAARAWVNFNGTGTVAIRASGNVSSITDNGTGDYTVNFTTAMPDANYAVAASAGRLGDKNTTIVLGNQATYAGNKTTTAVRVNCQTFQNGSTDTDMTDVSIFR